MEHDYVEPGVCAYCGETAEPYCHRHGKHDVRRAAKGTAVAVIFLFAIVAVALYFLVKAAGGGVLALP